MYKIYYDKINNKEVVDMSGVKTDVIAEFGLDPSTQEINLDLTTDAYSYVEDDVLKKKTITDDETEKASAKANKEANKANKKISIQSKLGLNNEEWNDLVDALS